MAVAGHDLNTAEVAYALINEVRKLLIYFLPTITIII